MAGSAGEVIRAGTVVERPLTDLVHDFFLRMRLRQIHLQAAGFGGNPGNICLQVDMLSFPERGFDNLGGIKALQGFHAGKQPRLEVLHFPRIRKIARQLDESALDHAAPLAEVALFERGAFRTALGLPERLALGLEQLRRISVLQHLAIFGDAICSGFLLCADARHAGPKGHCHPDLSHLFPSRW